MKRTGLLLVVFVVVACRSASPTPASTATSTTAATSAPPRVTAAANATPPSSIAVVRVPFDHQPAGTPPQGFLFGLTGSGAAARWIVRAEKDAPSVPNVLVQTDADATDNRFPVAVADSPSVKDVRVSVRCKPISGKVDQACGLVVRYKDENNYMLTRANALEDNVRLYSVWDGQRKQIAGWNGKVESGKWHTLVLDARGDTYQVTFDEKKIIEHRDATFAHAGRAGLWTKADSVTAFDDFMIEPR